MVFFDFSFHFRIGICILVPLSVIFFLLPISEAVCSLLSVLCCLSSTVSPLLLAVKEPHNTQWLLSLGALYYQNTHLHMLTFQIFISTISGTVPMFALTIVLALFVYKKNNPKDFYTILFSSTLAMCITYTIKYLLKIPRPEDTLVFAGDYRFPSGHATMAAVVMSLALYYTHLHIKNKLLRYLLYLCAVTWLLLVSYSRLYLNVHYTVDVFVGGCIGILSTVLVLTMLKYRRSRKKF